MPTKTNSEVFIGCLVVHVFSSFKANVRRRVLNYKLATLLERCLPHGHLGGFTGEVARTESALRPVTAIACSSGFNMIRQCSKQLLLGSNPGTLGHLKALVILWSLF